MSGTRRKKGLNQQQLGARVGTSQNIISLIEGGKLGSSSFVLPICKVLRIPIPMHYINKEQQRWALLGHILEEAHPEQFEATIQLLESMLAKELSTIAEAEPEEKAARAVGAASVTATPRAIDETTPLSVSKKKR